jgi:DNA-directed RNA polymerase
MFKREATSIDNPGVAMAMNENGAKYASALDKFKQSLGLKSMDYTRFKKYLQSLVDFKATALIKARQTKDRLAVFDKNDKVYFCWELDSRGRIYCKGYGVTLQGDKYCKSLLTPII